MIGASFRIEQTDGSYKTDLYTGHNGCIELQGAVHTAVRRLSTESKKETVLSRGRYSLISLTEPEESTAQL